MNQNKTRKEEKKNKKRIRNLNVEMNNHKENCVRKKNNIKRMKLQQNVDLAMNHNELICFFFFFLLNYK